MTITETTVRDVPPEVASLLHAWVKRRGQHIFIHYFIGVVGILASVVAAVDMYSPWASLWMVISSFCIAFVGFGNPRREYSKFAHAVRVLYMATLRYRHGQIEMKELLNAVEQGETIIQSYESDDPPSLRQIRDSLS
jgi:hypothetical protein